MFMGSELAISSYSRCENLIPRTFAGDGSLLLNDSKNPQADASSAIGIVG